MKITHRFILCKHCGKKIEVFDDEVKEGEKICESCGYGNDLLYDWDVEIFYEDF
jgi:ribosomal protein L37E